MESGRVWLMEVGRSGGGGCGWSKGWQRFVLVEVEEKGDVGDWVLLYSQRVRSRITQRDCAC